MEDKQIKLKVFTSQNELYMHMLIELRTKIGWSKDEKYGEPIFTVPFILTCAAALECALNDYIISHFSIDDKRSNELTSGYLSMNLRGKLTNIVSLLTNGKYTINTEHKTYQILVELIKVRNRLVHNKSSYEECEGVVVTKENGDVHIKIPEDVSKKIDDYSMGINPPIGRFQDALEDFYDRFLYVRPKDKFIENDLIISTENA